MSYPGIERYQSVYEKSYDWIPRRLNQSIKSNIYCAGQESKKLHISHEPQLQRKRRITGPYTSDHVKLEFDSGQSVVEDDFMLLGEKNERFAPNVPYRNPKYSHARPSTAPQQKLKERRRKFIDNEYSSTPETPRFEKHILRPATADPRRRPRVSPPRKQRGGTYYKPNKRSRSHETRIKDEAIQTKNSYNLEEAIKSAANKGVQSNTFGSYEPSYYDIYQRTRPRENNFREPSRSKARRKEKFHENSEHLNPAIKSDVELKMKAKARSKRSPSPPKWLPPNYFIENGQIYSDKNFNNDLKKDVKHYMQRNKSNDHNEVDDYYAKRYELGLAKNRPQPEQRMTEYRRQYGLKDSNYQEPLFHSSTHNRSHLDQPKYYQRPTSMSEYRRQFVPFPVSRSRSFSPEPLRNRAVRPNSAPKKTNARFYRNSSPRNGRQSVSPPPRVMIGSHEYTPATVLNPQRMSFPLGPRKSQKSEYGANFKHPLKSDDNNKENNFDKPDAPKSGYYQQISELRRQAEQYKVRARGTHFSREHMAQLLSESNYHWDPPTSESSRHLLGGVGGGLVNGESGKQMRSKSLSPRIQSEDEYDEDEEIIVTPPRIRDSRKQPNLNRTTSTAGMGDHNKSTSVGRKMQNSTKSMKKIPSQFDHPAGKPSYDPYYILDEGASHDTPLKSGNRSKTMSRSQSKHQASQNKSKVMENGGGYGYPKRKEEDDLRLNGLMVSTPSELSTSIRSLASSSSLASETLERARKRQSNAWND